MDFGTASRQAQRGLCFLHRKVQKNPCALCGAAAYCCGAVAPCAIAALLGRFLPRLGPLAHCKRPFFSCRRQRKEIGAGGSPRTIKSNRRPSLKSFRGGLEWAEIA